MKYENTLTGTFIDRPNRFIAHVDVNGKTETVHVKNTGRCRELLIPGVTVVLQQSDKVERKTKYDLIAVKKESLGWVNIDSQIPNRVVEEWLKSGNSLFENITFLKPEKVYGDSRIDFYFEQGETKNFIEVKGCTLEIDGKGYFPDAPTERGIKHLKELSEAIKDGFNCYLVYVIAMPGVSVVYPNYETHPAYGMACEEARKAGVKIIFLRCDVTPDEIKVVSYGKEEDL